MAQLVKFLSKDGKYTNVGFQTPTGFIIPIKVVVSKHYYSLLAQATEIVIDYKKKGE